ncbi:hypothetical protein GYK47_03405 [Lactobacillus iners]|nr:hypothetical protein GYK47_03405 [Lactobacillus iners]
MLTEKAALTTQRMAMVDIDAVQTIDNLRPDAAYSAQAVYEDHNISQIHNLTRLLLTKMQRRMLLGLFTKYLAKRV